MIKIKASYEGPEELKKLLEILKPHILTLKAPKGQQGRFRRVYIVLN